MRENKLRRYKVIGALIGFGIFALPMIIAHILGLINDGLGLNNSGLDSLEQSLFMISYVLATPIAVMLFWITVAIAPDKAEFCALYLSAIAPFISPIVGALIGLWAGKAWYHNRNR